MRFHDSEDYRSSDRMQLLHNGPSLSREEGRLIFREMVRAEAKNGNLSNTRRKRLIQYAAALQLTPLDASRIVSEVCFELAVHDPLQPPVLYRMVEAAATPQRWPAWARALVAMIASMLVFHLVVRLVRL
ncbi:MAG TPA: hypothetical protein P5572_21330 [Phycisphaerae bacterium]|nr:hypothetical protein [Phycisphaerales bacterium]HRX87577.1 hypothetical protein [Phycisphaerae bacterium]